MARTQQDVMDLNRWFLEAFKKIERTDVDAYLLLSVCTQVYYSLPPHHSNHAISRILTKLCDITHCSTLTVSMLMIDFWFFQLKSCWE